MNATLSQEEIDALRQGVADGDVGIAAEEAAGGEALPYDLFAGERVVGRRFAALDAVHERCARRLRRSLATLVGSLPTVEVGECEALKFETLRNRLPAPSSLHVFTMEPLHGQALLAVSPPLAFALVDRVFGGAGRPPATLERREHSTIEAQMIQRVVVRALADLSEAWAQVHHLECRLVRSESDPAALALFAADDPVLAVELLCDVGSGAAPLTLAIPCAAIEPIRAKLDGPRAVTVAGGADRDWLAAMTEAVWSSEVVLSAELRGRDISARELLRLRAGDVVTLGIDPEDPLLVRVEGVPLMMGLPGLSRGNNAVCLRARE